MNTGRTINFPRFTGTRCLMMPFIQGDGASVPEEYATYRRLIGAFLILCS